MQLTRMYALQRKKEAKEKRMHNIRYSIGAPTSKVDREKRKQSNKEIKIYDRAASMRGNPFSGETTNLPFNQDNRKSYGTPELLTEQDVLESILFNGKRFRVRKSDVKLAPEMVTDEIKDFYRAKIYAGAVRSAKNKRDKC